MGVRCARGDSVESVGSHKSTSLLACLLFASPLRRLGLDLLTGVVISHPVDKVIKPPPLRRGLDLITGSVYKLQVGITVSCPVPTCIA